MPPVDQWLSIIFNVPVWGFLVLILLIIISLVFTLSRYRKLITKAQSNLAKPLDNEIDGPIQSSKREDYLQFIYNLSHEVSNPLQIIQTTLENSEKCTVDDFGRWNQYQIIIKSEIKRLSTLIENLRLLSRLESQRDSVKREPVNLRGVIESVIMAQVELAEAKGINLLYRGPKRPARVLGNRDQLIQVIMNLVDNSIKYAKEDGGEVIINVQEEVNHLCIRVLDDGIGISSEDVDLIFDTAYRVPMTRSTRRAGSGLGLAIVKRIVEQHGGEIFVQSKEGEGTTITFRLPLYLPPI